MSFAVLSTHARRRLQLRAGEWGDKSSAVYLLSDFATVRERRVSKLIPTLAASRELIRQVDRKFIIRVRDLWTTAFTNKPVSMKYRGVFEVLAQAQQINTAAASARDSAEVYRSGTPSTDSSAPAPRGAAQARDAHRPREAAAQFLEEGENARYMEKAEFDRLLRTSAATAASPASR
jgi:hypothetical protein